MNHIGVQGLKNDWVGIGKLLLQNAVMIGRLGWWMLAYQGISNSWR